MICCHFNQPLAADRGGNLHQPRWRGLLCLATRQLIAPSQLRPRDAPMARWHTLTREWHVPKAKNISEFVWKIGETPLGYLQVLVTLIRSGPGLTFWSATGSIWHCRKNGGIPVSPVYRRPLKTTTYRTGTSLTKKSACRRTENIDPHGLFRVVSSNFPLVRNHPVAVHLAPKAFQVHSNAGTRYAGAFMGVFEMRDTHINSFPIQKSQVLDSFGVLHNRPHMKWIEFQICSKLCPQKDGMCEPQAGFQTLNYDFWCWEVGIRGKWWPLNNSTQPFGPGLHCALAGGACPEMGSQNCGRHVENADAKPYMGLWCFLQDFQRNASKPWYQQVFLWVSNACGLGELNIYTISEEVLQSWKEQLNPWKNP